MTRLHCYAVFGERLASAIPLPELDEIPAGPAQWTVTESAQLPAMRDARVLGDDLLYDDVHARLHAHAEGHRIDVDDTGSFDISLDRKRISVQARPGAWDDFLRAHLTGRVLATTLFLDGMLPLHASAVITRDGVIGFLAPKGYGKSTLALALTAAGAWLVSDDTLAVDPARGLARPGVHGLRVNDDALGAVGIGDARMRTREGKHVVTELGAERIFARETPLAALYLLVPLEPTATAVDRSPLPPALAAISIVAHVKIGRMLGASEAPAMLARGAEVARRVPTFQLGVPRDLATLSATARTILAWHGTPEP